MTDTNQNKSRAIAGRTARCRCKFRYVSNFSTASKRFLCHSTKLFLDFFRRLQ